MLRNVSVATFVAWMASLGAVHAEDRSTLVATPSAGPSEVQAKATDDLYSLCAFYPKKGTCEAVYQKAMQDESLLAETVRAEYTGYARYLGGTETLTDADRQYLKDTGILVPSDLTPDNQAGLHRVINDPGLNPDARRTAVNNFLSRAVEAELYCGFNSCDVPAREKMAGT